MPTTPVISWLIGIHFTAMEVSLRDYWDMATHSLPPRFWRWGYLPLPWPGLHPNPLPPSCSSIRALACPSLKMGLREDKSQYQSLYLILFIVGARLYQTSNHRALTRLHSCILLHDVSTPSRFIFPQRDISPTPIGRPFKRQFKCSFVYMKP